MKPETAPELLRLAVTSLTSDELREWLSKPSALTARRFLASMPAPFCNLAWVGLPDAKTYNRRLVEDYHAERGEQ